MEYVSYLHAAHLSHTYTKSGTHPAASAPTALCIIMLILACRLGNLDRRTGDVDVCPRSAHQLRAQVRRGRQELAAARRLV